GASTGEGARPRGGGDEEGPAAVGEQAAIEEAQGLVHEARRLVVLERHRLPHLRIGIAERVTAPGDRDVAVVGAGDAVLVHLPPGQVTHERDRADVAVGNGPRRAEELGNDSLRKGLCPEGAEDDLAEPGLDRQDRRLQHAEGRGAAQFHGGPEGRGDAEEGGHARRPAVLLAHLRRHQAEHAVDVVARHAAVVDRALRRFEAEAHGAHAGHLPEAREADAGDRVAAAQPGGIAHRRTYRRTYRGSASVALPTTLRSPVCVSVQMSQSTTRAPFSSRTAVTVPLHVMTSPGQVSFANRARNFRTWPTPAAFTRNSPRYPIDSIPCANTPG